MRKREHEQASSLQSVLENEGLEEDLSSLIQTIAQAAISLAGDIVSPVCIDVQTIDITDFFSRPFGMLFSFR